MTDDEIVCEILARCRESVERGEAVDREAILRAHPELAQRLRAGLDVLQLLDQAYAGPDEELDGADPGPALSGACVGPYRLTEPIGWGGMGSVWKAVVERPALGLVPGTPVAIKWMHPHLLLETGFLDRFRREARVGMSVVSENVVRTLDATSLEVEGRDHPYLVMEHVEGQTLRGLVQELERVPEELCRHIGREVARGLAAIHAAGIVHRDVKPENVLITKDQKVKVMDLGVARAAAGATQLSEVGTFLGSVAYAAPERFQRGFAEADARSDLHALGLVLYELLCGFNPYAGDDLPQIVRKVLSEEPKRPSELVPLVSPFFEEVVLTLLKKDPSERFESAALLVEVLEAGEAHAWWKGRDVALRASSRRSFRRLRVPRETEVYGRETEIRELHARFEQAAAGDGRVVLLEGEAGIGKTRLVDELVGRLVAEGKELHFLHGSYPPGGAATGAGAFIAAYREQLGDAGSRDLLATVPRLVPAFDALLLSDAAPSGSQPLTKDSLQTCFVLATRALAAQRTTVVLIDDLHFAPDEGLALFASLAHAVSGHRILLLGTARPGVPEEWRSSILRLHVASRIELRRLGPKELVRLLEGAFRSEALASTLGAQIALKSDGNPFFAFEIVRGLREGQFISQAGDGSWISSKMIEEIQVPSSVMDLVHARVSVLAREERDLLDVACCCGFEFDPLLVGEAVGLGLIPVLKALSQVERKHRLVRAVGPRFEFDHHQVQEALYLGLPELLRRAYHASLADALLAREGRSPTATSGASSVALCEHLLRGGRSEGVTSHLGAAIAHLEHVYRFGASVSLLERALEVPGLLEGIDRARYLLSLAEAIDRVGGPDRQIAACREAELLARGGGDEALEGKAAGACALAFLRRADHASATEAATRARDIAKRVGMPHLEAQALGILGLVSWTEGRQEDARTQFEEAALRARTAGDRRIEANATGNLGNVFKSEGRDAEAKVLYERSRALSREAGDLFGEAISVGNLGRILSSAGRYPEAREHFERALSLARETGNRRGESSGLGNVGTAFWYEGRMVEARQHYESGLVLAREVGYREGEALGLQCTGNILLEQGDLVGARSLLEEALRIANEAGFTQAAVSSLIHLGDVLSKTGEVPRARTLFLEAAERAAEAGMVSSHVEALAQLAGLPGGNATEALAAFARHRPRMREVDCIDVLHLLWKATGDRRHIDEARRLLEQALARAPESCRATMREGVMVYREVLAEGAALDAAAR